MNYVNPMVTWGVSTGWLWEPISPWISETYVVEGGGSLRQILFTPLNVYSFLRIFVLFISWLSAAQGVCREERYNWRGPPYHMIILGSKEEKGDTTDEARPTIWLYQRVRNRREIQLTRPALPYDYTRE